MSEAHPRVCGENVRPLRKLFRQVGSPPRVRGKRRRGTVCQRGAGLTPACAGKTSSFLMHIHWTQAHPRVCGENALVRHAGLPCRGSPPRVRGKPSQPGSKTQTPRLTPACAGKTKQSKTHYVGGWAHPRVCGENAGFSLGFRRSYGSPPRVRGKRICQTHYVQHHRLTPACAGKTRRCR